MASATGAASAPLPSTEGSPYVSGAIGYDLSFNTRNYPQIPFGFAVVGVTAGKAFTRNARLASEYDWARLASVTGPTMYVNLNAPYGSTANNENVSTPKTCDALFGAPQTSAIAGGTFPEPTPCAAYNYGYRAAEDALAYAREKGITSRAWWLDIEEANSWSENTAVHDAAIQGALDYFNGQGIRVGIYSVPYMWRQIAGSDFSPTQTVEGKSVTTPTWFPIGIANQVIATNSCKTKESFIKGSPVWVIQYVLDSTAVDQTFAC